MTTVVPRRPLEETKQKIRVAFYGRVSTQEQSLEGYSPQFQREQLAEHLKRKDYKGWFTKDEWSFFDVGSGSECEERKSLQALLKLVRERKIDLVLCWKIDRLSRNLSDLLNLFEEMDKYGVGFASVKEDLDFTGAIGKLIFQIFGALAEFERENIKMRTEEGKKASALQGNYVGGSVPYGYEAVKNQNGKGKKLRLVKEEAAIAKQIFEWFTYEGKAVTWIAKMLNDTGIPKSRGNVRTKDTKWHEHSVHNMLRNEVYRGSYIVNRLRLISHKPELYEERPQAEWICTQVQPVVDDALFYLTQQKLANKHLHAARGGGGTEVYMLRGKIRDVVTGRGFVGYCIGIGTKHYRRKQCKHEDVYHPSMSVSATVLEDIVWSLMEKALADPEGFLALHEQSATDEAGRDALARDLRQVEDALSAMNNRIEAARRCLYEEKVNERQVQEDIATFEREREQLFEQKKKLETDITNLGQYQLACQHLRYFSSKYTDKHSFTYEEKQRIVDMFVERVDIFGVKENRKARVVFRFDPKAVSSAIPLGRTDVLHREANTVGVAADKRRQWWVRRGSNPRPKA